MTGEPPPFAQVDPYAHLPRRPVFWFVWPASRPQRLDEDATQARWLRVTPRGPWRLALLVAASAAVVAVILPALAAALVASAPAIALGLIILGVPAVALLARAWVCGAYVADRGLKVSGMLRTAYAPWAGIADVQMVRGRVAWLGTPLRISGESCVALLADGTSWDTSVCTASPDLWLRPQAWEAAADRLRLWLRESRAT